MCSLNCTYCFYHDLMSKREVPSYGFMSDEISGILIQKALTYASGQCSFGFQGGEPTMIGLDFYRKFVELVKKHNHKNLEISYFIQTNGYLLSEDYHNLFYPYTKFSLEVYSGQQWFTDNDFMLYRSCFIKRKTVIQQVRWLIVVPAKFPAKHRFPDSAMRWRFL